MAAGQPEKKSTEGSEWPTILAYPAPRQPFAHTLIKLKKEENHALCTIDLIFQIFYFSASALTVIRMGWGGWRKQDSVISSRTPLGS